MIDSIKIRDLVSKHPEDDNVVLNDLIHVLIEAQVPLGKLEVHNYKDAVVDAIKKLSDVESLLKLLKRRLREEVRTEVLEFHNTRPKQKRNMNPKSLENLKKK